MRTTVTIDDDSARELHDAAHREQRPFKQVLNDAIRRGLRASEPGSDGPFDYPSHSATLKPGWDTARFNQLADELDDEATLHSAAVDAPTSDSALGKRRIA